MKNRLLAWRIALVTLITLAAIAAALLIPPMPQPLAYHDFADAREAAGIPNFLNVTSNVGFLVVGIAGLFIALGRRACFQFTIERRPYTFFFVGVALTAAGSTYYHLNPDNETLFWDRLPMTIAFMALVSSQIVDRIDIRAGIRLLIPMLVLGVVSVMYWRATERANAGNVIPYAVLQAYSMVILLLMAAFAPSRYTRGTDLYWVFIWYALSKALETYDSEVFSSLGYSVSGHTLKHIAAAFAGGAVCVMLARRTLIDQNAHSLAPSPGVRAAHAGDSHAKRR
ncbi:MAG: hypothetical protein IT507_10940 [Burkholderiaceae bacterium]|nr:hypothetical protein [Burkholderiaceae bacterium]